MTMTLLDIMRTSAVIPVIAIDEPEHAVPLAKALVAGGIRVLEVTLRTKHGLAAIKAMSAVEGAIVGVGTLTQPEEFAAARDAGAVFGVSPGLTAKSTAITSGLDVLSTGAPSGIPPGAVALTSGLPAPAGRKNFNVPLSGSFQAVLPSFLKRYVSFTATSAPAGSKRIMCLATLASPGCLEALKTSSAMPVVGRPGGSM